MSASPRADSPPRLPRRGRRTDDPRMIGPWKVGRTIGKGASGRVKIARHAKTGKYAAVKIVSKTQLVNSRRSMHNLADEAERILLGLEREIVIMKLIDHPNVMQLYDVYETSGELYLILEYIEGGELFDYICEMGRLPATEALDYFQQLIGAVSYCHRFKIAHRDLKPENLLLDKDKILKVADFGMAAWQGCNNNLLETACGSPHYAAPEVVSGEPYDGTSADIWSCGVVLYALLAGRLPIDDPDLTRLLDKVKMGKFIMPPDIEPQAKDLIAKMLEKNVQKRIKISEILTHPWFTSRKQRTKVVQPPSLEELSKPISDVGDIDWDIFGNLRTLWHGAPDNEIVAGLTSSKDTWEKIVYHLLIQYRTRHLENYNEELEKARSLRRSQRRKGNKPERTPSSTRTPVHHPPRPDPPTPRRAGNQSGRSGTGPPPLPPPPVINPLRPIGDSPHVRYPLPSPGQGGTRSVNLSPAPSPLAELTSPKSPIWQALDILPPADTPELHDEKVQRYFQQIVEHLNVMQNKSPAGLSPNLQALLSPLSPYIPAAPRLVGVHDDPESKKRRPESIRIASNTLGLGLVSSPDLSTPTKATSSYAGKENHGVSALRKKSSLRKGVAGTGGGAPERTALSERRVQIILPPKPDREKDREQAAAQTPGSGGQFRILRSPLWGSNSSSSASPRSPAFSLSEGSSVSFGPAGQQPRRSWFGNLFKFRPVCFQLLSTRETEETHEACSRILEDLGVRIAAVSAVHVASTDDWEGTCLLKCQFDDVRDTGVAGVITITKAVSFRLEINPPSDVQRAMGYTCVVEMTQEKGALSTFKLIFSSLRREWDLDTQLVTPVPILSPVVPVGRLVEDLRFHD